MVREQHNYKINDAGIIVLKKVERSIKEGTCFEEVRLSLNLEGWCNKTTLSLGSKTIEIFWNKGFLQEEGAKW